MPADPCPPPADLLAFHAGDLPADGIDRVAAHLEGCVACEAVLTALDGRTGAAASAIRGRPAGPTQETAGSVVGGRYTLVEPVGEGGMGTVWRADQFDPVRRPVAVKLIKPGMDSAAVLRRFAAERQALALMDHPNIARVLDAGATASGRPFFAMELVAGVPITRYCDDHRLTPRQRLELFVPVCRAVQHAHQKGVIHRDLKPSNVLVAEVDGRPVPKVIDFGVAKATGPAPDDATQATAVGAVVGTPEYMAPEQAGGDPADIDTRADVYALGVLLYELLTGSTPLTRQRLKQAALLEVLRLVREEEPPTPSGRLSTADGLPGIAADRATEPRRLAGLMRGELDWIALKCLEKDRGRRYDSATALARDVERYLLDEAVEAGPPSVRYRLRKFARRHRGRVLVGAAVLLALAAGGAAAVWQAVRATRAEAAERLAADDARREAAAARSAEGAALEEADTRAAVLAFFADKVFAAARPEGRPGGLGRDVTLRKAIDAAVPAVGPTFKARPAVEEAVRAALAHTLHDLGEAARAVEQGEAVHRSRAARLGPGHPDTADAAGSLATLYADVGRVPEAVGLLEGAVAAALARLGPDHPKTSLFRHNLAMSYARAGRAADAVRLHEEVLATRTRVQGPSSGDALQSLSALGGALLDAGRTADGARLLEQAVRLHRERPGADQFDLLDDQSRLAVAYQTGGRAGDAVRLLEAVLPVRRDRLGPNHPLTLRDASRLAMSYLEAGRPADAVALQEDTVRRLRASPAADGADTRAGMFFLARALRAAGRVGEALRLHEQLLAERKAKLGPDDWETLASANAVAVLYAQLGRAAEAVPLQEQVLAAQRRLHGTSSVQAVASQFNLAAAYLAVGRPADARPLMAAYLESQRQRHGPESPGLAVELDRVGEWLLRYGRHADAEPPLRESLALRGRLDSTGWATAATRSLLGSAVAGQSRYADAEPLLMAAYDGLRAKAADTPPASAAAIGATADRLARLYDAWQKPEAAAKWRAERTKHPPEVAPPPRPVGGR